MNKLKLYYTFKNDRFKFKVHKYQIHIICIICLHDSMILYIIVSMSNNYFIFVLIRKSVNLFN